MILRRGKDHVIAPGNDDEQRSLLAEKAVLDQQVRAARAELDGATLFGYQVEDPERYGVAEVGPKGELLGIEGFEDVLHDAGLHARRGWHGVQTGRQDERRHWIQLVELRGQPQAVLARHHDVAEHNVGRRRRHHSQGRVRAIGLADFIVARAQPPRQNLPNPTLIVDDQH